MIMPVYKPQNKRKSFFEEQRAANLNPNFVNSLDFNYLRQSVKRIVKDIADGNIIPEDYKYLTNYNILNACIQESYENYQINKCLRHALTYYRYIGLTNRVGLEPDVDVNTDMTTSGLELTKVQNRENTWFIIFNTFQALSNNINNHIPMDIMQILSNIIRIDKNSIRNL